jgi:hypothetical protein
LLLRDLSRFLFQHMQIKEGKNLKPRAFFLKNLVLKRRVLKK